MKGFPGPTTFAKITDGTSSTFVIGEKYVRSDSYGGGGWSDDKGWSDGWDLDVMRSTCFLPYQDNDPIGFSFTPVNSTNDIFGHKPTFTILVPPTPPDSTPSSRTARSTH